MLSDPAIRPPRALPLGRLLLERGLLSEEQLEAALAEQKRTGAKPLGEVLIELGFVDPSTIAMALASQHGGLLKTEYGFATGFGTARPTGPMPVPPTSGSDSRPQPPVVPDSPLAESVSPASPQTPALSPQRTDSALPGTASREQQVDRAPESPTIEPPWKPDAPAGAAYLQPPVTPAPAASDNKEPAQVSRASAPSEGKLTVPLVNGRPVSAEPLSQSEESARTETLALGQDTPVTDLTAQVVTMREQLDELRSRTIALENELATARVAIEQATVASATTRIEGQTARADVEQGSVEKLSPPKANRSPDSGSPNTHGSRELRNAQCVSIATATWEISATEATIEEEHVHSELVLVCPELRRRAQQLLTAGHPHSDA